jgi:hypothetical protein
MPTRKQHAALDVVIKARGARRMTWCPNYLSIVAYRKITLKLSYP